MNHLQVVIQYVNHAQKRQLSGPWIQVAAALCAGDHHRAIQHVISMKEAKDYITASFIQSVVEEADNLCDPDNHSLFRESTIEDLNKFNFTQQDLELQLKAPLLASTLHAVAENTNIKRNVKKTKKTLIPGVTTAAGILLNCRSQTMNAHQVLTSLVLKKSGAKLSAFQHLQNRNISTNYKTVMRRQLDFGVDFDKDVKQWAKETSEAECNERQLQDSGSKELVEEFNKAGLTWVINFSWTM